MTISQYPGEKPALTQTQPAFDQNVQDLIDWIVDSFVDETNAVAVAMNLNSTTDTSSSSVAIGTGAKTFIVSADKSFQPGMYLVIADTAAPSTNSMWGIIDSYSGTSLVMNIITVLGSGTIAAWTISQSSSTLSYTGETDFTGAINTARATVASHATTADIWSAAGNDIDWTGTATTTAFPAAPQAGASRRLIIATSGASFTAGANLLIQGVPSGSSITLEAQDEVFIHAITTTQFKLLINKYDGLILPSMHISGLVIANNATDATNDIDISTGECRDATNVTNLFLRTALTKRLDAVWAVGTNQGGLDTGSVANSNYYVWLIKRLDTGVVDVLFSLSSTAPTMPTDYTIKRLIGWIKRSSGAIVGFHAYETAGGGLNYLWDSPTLDLDLSAGQISTTATTIALKVPLHFSVEALFNMIWSDASASEYVYLSCPDQTDLLPSTTAAPLFNYRTFSTGVAGVWAKCRTSSIGQIRIRGSAVIDVFRAVTTEFTWSRK
jgi:hypothetical protein